MICSSWDDSSLDLGPVAGEVEEDVVEAGPLQADVVEVDAGLVEPGRDAGERADPLGGGRDVPGVAVDVDLADLGAHDLGRARRPRRAGSP